MPLYAYGNVPSSPFVPASIREQEEGLRPEYVAILDLLDFSEPAWPAISAVLRDMKNAGVELSADMAKAAIKLGRERHRLNQWTPAPKRDRPLTLVSAASSVVYYIRRGHLIKIGTTADPAQRFNDLLPDEIYAVEPGGRPEEKMRHRQFRHLKRKGEHFNMADELLAHIRAVRATYGDPDPSWPTSNTLGTGMTYGTPSPMSAEILTTLEASERFGVKLNTLHNWVRRGWLQHAGRTGNNGRTCLFYADDVRALLWRVA